MTDIKETREQIVKLLSRAEIPDYAKDITEPLVDIVVAATQAQKERDLEIAISHKIPASEYRDTNIGMNEAANIKVEAIATAIDNQDDRS